MRYSRRFKSRRNSFKRKGRKSRSSRLRKYGASRGGIRL